MRGTVAFALVWAACGGGSNSSTDSAAMGTPAPDPRFKWVGAFPSYTTSTELVGGTGVGFGSTTSVFGPAAIGSGGEAVVFDYAPATAVGPFSSGFEEITGTPSALAGSAVATSFGFTGNEVVYTWQGMNATTTMQMYSGGSAGDLMGSVQTAAATGDVTTALAFDGSERVMFAYADSSLSDTYDTTAQTGDVTTIGTMAQAVASGGYVITALGQIDGSNYGVVGTKITGSAATHDAMVITIAAGGDTTPLATAQMQGYAIVGAYFTDPLTGMFVLER
ncbi:MAG TPA: hypothetical protein VGG74_22820 [Kofleriaceae bacterium]|jgi:hypothetical protein